MRVLNKLMPYDSYERHKAVDLLLGSGFRGTVLDAGGLSGSLAPFLPGAEILALNLDESGDVVYGGRSPSHLVLSMLSSAWTHSNICPERIDLPLLKSAYE